MGITIKLSDSVIEKSNYLRWYLIPTVRILIVADGGITLSYDTVGFGLAKVIDTLESEAFYDNVRFSITGASRTGSQNTVPSATSKQFKYTGFKFNMPGFNINDYDQIWFFGFDPGNDASPDDANIDTISGNNPNPLNDPAEIEILSTWMNTNKGGVLAIGDHHYLGASLCSKIPRVRKMRRWTNADHVPSISGPDRHDTNQDKAGTGVIPFNAQSDDVPQHIEVLKKRYVRNIFTTIGIPHPILCGADGEINIFPDHPHEGEVLGTYYDTGTDGTPVNLTGNYPGAIPEFPDAVSGAGKPEPQIIALGHPLNNPRLDKNQAHNPEHNPTHTNSSAPFGLVSVYDGEQAGVGRVVTDSTWHHWFNINLVGLDTVATADKYRKIQNYYTNVAIWLCNANLRHRILTTWVWDFLVREFDPMRFSIHDSIWRLGISARDALGQTASQCTTYDWIQIFIPELVNVFEVPHKSPCFSCPPIDIFEISMLGGIMKQMVPLVEKYRLHEKFNRRHIDIEEINNAVKSGLALGYDELLSTFDESLKRATHLFKMAKTGFKGDAIDLKLEINKSPLKVEIESILFNSPVFYNLINKNEAFISVSVSNGFSRLNIEPLKIYLKEQIQLQGNALFYKTNFTIIDDVFQDGEILKIELYLNDELYSERNKIYESVLSGEVKTWMGVHTPNLNAEQNTSVYVTIQVSESSNEKNY